MANTQSEVERTIPISLAVLIAGKDAFGVMDWHTAATEKALRAFADQIKEHYFPTKEINGIPFAYNGIRNDGSLTRHIAGEVFEDGFRNTIDQTLEAFIKENHE